MTICKGRPQSTEKRAEKELRAYELLDSLGVFYERVDHEAAMTMEACREIDDVLNVKMCKNLFLRNRQGTDFYLLLISGEKPFKTKELSAQIGTARLSFADGGDMEKYLDITPGSLSVLGLMNDKENKVRLLIDRDVVKDDFIGVHPCVNTSSLKLKTNELIEKIIPAMHHNPTYVEL